MEQAPHEVPLISFDSDEGDAFAPSPSSSDRRPLPFTAGRDPFDAFGYSYPTSPSSSSEKRAGSGSADCRSPGFEAGNPSIPHRFEALSLSRDVSSTSFQAEQECDGFRMHSPGEGSPSIFYDAHWNEEHLGGFSAPRDGGDPHSTIHASRLEANVSEDRNYREAHDPSSNENVFEDRLHGSKLNEDTITHNSWVVNDYSVTDKDSRKTSDIWFKENRIRVQDSRKIHDPGFKEDVQSETSMVSVSYPYIDLLSSDEICSRDAGIFAEASAFSPQIPPYRQEFESTSSWSASSSHYTDASSEISADQSIGYYEATDSKPDFLEDFVASGKLIADQKGVEGPVSFELRPPPLQEASIQCPLRVLACTDTSVWSACEQGMMVWDISAAWKSKCDGKENLEGDKDAAQYTLLPLHGSAPISLFTDKENNIIWSGHRDGKVAAWPFSVNSSGKNTVGGSNAPFIWQAHHGPVLAIVRTSYGELWTGSDYGSLRAWPSDVVGGILLPSRIPTTLVETSFIDIRSRATQAAASSLSGTDVRFLVAEHSQCCVWSGGSHVLALWDARTRDVLKVFGPNADADSTNLNISPVRAIGRGDDMQMNMTKVSKKEKNMGTLSFFQRSRNAVIGAADAVLRATVGSPGIEDNRRIEAVVASANGNVWVGYGGGRLIRFDCFGNRLHEYHRNSTFIRCMCSFGNVLFVGYADGVIRVFDTSSGKLCRGWRAHKSSVARVGVSSNHLFTLSDNGGIRGWVIVSPSTFTSRFHSAMISKESTYVKEENIKILTGTWNVGQERACSDSLTKWLAKSIEVNVVVIGLQEVEMGAGALAIAAAKETVGMEGSINGQWWLENIGNALNQQKEFVLVASRQLAGLVIGAWVSKGLLPYVGGVGVGAVACGFGRAFGNKGAAAIKMMVFRRTICVVNGHFAAHMEGVSKRNADFVHIYQRMAFGRIYGGLGLAASAMAASAVQIIRSAGMRQDGSSVEDINTKEDEDPEEEIVVTSEVSEADLLIWVGDFNYRLANVSYADAVDWINERRYEKLLEKDQLRTEMMAGRVFQGMREAKIEFPPTYKFDKGCSTIGGYDSSEKRRVPAWCDRVIYRDSFDPNNAGSKIGSLHPVSARVTWYGSCMEATESDHKPVSCCFDVRIVAINEAARRWEYGKFLRSDDQAQRIQKQMELVPEIRIDSADVRLVDGSMSKLKLSNPSSSECAAIFCFRAENESSSPLPPDRGQNGLPSWLQVLPASGLLEPGLSQDITLHYIGDDVWLLDQGFGSTGPLNQRTASLALEVKGVFSRASKVHTVKVSHARS